MKRFKELVEELLDEGSYEYPGDDMTMKELKIAINAAKNILDMIEDGAMVQRWQISAIVKASEELASVCTSMRADEEDDDWADDEPMYVGFEYPSMYGEEVEQIDELSKKTLGSYVKKASADQYFKGQEAQYHDNKAKNATGPFAKETKKKHYALAAKANEKASNRDTGISRAIDRLTKEELEQIDEISIEKVQKVRDRAASRVALSIGKTEKDPKTGLKKYIPATDDEMELAKKGMKSFMAAGRAITRKAAAKRKNEEVEINEEKLERRKETVGAHHLDRDSGEHKMFSRYTGSLVRREHTVTDKNDNILGQGLSPASAMAKAKLKKSQKDALMHDDNQIIKVHNTAGGQNVGTQVSTPGKGRWFKDHEEAMAHAKSLPGKIRFADKSGHVD